MKWVIIMATVAIAAVIVRSLLRSARREWFIGDTVTRYQVGKHLGWSSEEIARRIRRFNGIQREERLMAMAPAFDKLCAGGVSANPTNDERDELNMLQLATEVLEERGLLRRPKLSELKKSGKQAVFVSERVIYHISITPTVLRQRGATMAEFAERLKW